MLRLFLLLATLSTCLLVDAQNTLLPRVAVYNTSGERYVVDSVELTDSLLIMHVGELTFDIEEERFTRSEVIEGGTFALPDQIYSFNTQSDGMVVGQVLSYRLGIISVKNAYGDTVEVYRNELRGMNLEKQNVFARPAIRNCATTNFISSPYALNSGELVFTSNVYANTLEIGLGDGFSAKVLSSVIPFLLPTGYEFSYKKTFVGSNFSAGISAGQVWSFVEDISVSDQLINSSRDYLNFVTPSVTYHMQDAYLKGGFFVFSGSSSISRRNAFIGVITYSTPGFNNSNNRWNFTLNISSNKNTFSSGLNINSFLLAGYQVHAPVSSYTVGLGFSRGREFSIIPFPWAQFSLYSSKEQRAVSKAAKLHRRMRFTKRAIDVEIDKAASTRARRLAREAKQEARRNR